MNHSVAMNLLNHHALSLRVLVKHLATIESTVDVGTKMKSLNDNRQFKKTLELFDQIKNNKIENYPSLVFTQALKACARIGDLQCGMNIHRLIESRLNDDTYILTSLIHVYMQCDDVKNGELLFNKTTKRTLPIYGTMMKGYIKNHMPNKAIDLFNQIKNPDKVILIFFFNACAALKTKQALDLIKQTLATMPKSYHSDPFILSSLLDALMKCGDIEYAESLFRSSKTKVLSMYGAMMKGYVENDLAEKAISLFKDIKNPSEIAINIFFNACAALKTKQALDLTKQTLATMPKSYHSNPFILSSLLDALMKCGDIEYAESLFRSSKTKVLSMYGAMMKGYVENDLAEKAITLFKEIEKPSEINLIVFFTACARLQTEEALNLMKQVSKQMPNIYYSNSRLLNALFDAYIKCNDIASAEVLFPKVNKSVENYGNLMTGFNKLNKPDKTLELFNKMKLNGIDPNIVIYHCVIQALCQIGIFSIAQAIINEMPQSFLDDNIIKTSLIDMWGKLGDVNQAKEIFQNIHQPDQVMYNAMINSYGLNGMASQAIELYRRMPKEFIDEITNICVLNACSHAGFVDQAYSIFLNIQNKTESIYGSMVDCYSRASCFQEAQSLIDEYERTQAPVLSMHMALLSGARNYKNAQLSQSTYDRMVKIFPNMTNPLQAAAVLLANVYESSGDSKKASDVRIQLHKSGKKKKIGLSWTAINGKISKFRAHDLSHPRSTEIYAEAEKISMELEKHGHTFDSSWITRPLNQDETVQSVLCGHSERLAIAWNFVENPNAKLIQIAKNLRVCGDCHRATKLIATIRQCDIIVRDSNRIHFFNKNGQCSCNDYF